MNWKTAKNQKELEETYGNPIEFEKEDNVIKSVTITTGEGKKLRFASSYGYGISVFTPAPPTTVKKYEVSGTIGKLPFKSEVFDERNEAVGKMRELESEFESVVSTLEVKEIEVPEEE